MIKVNNSFFKWFEKHHSRYKGVLFDIDGTVIRGKNKMPGIENLLSFLNNNSIPWMFLTNDANHSHIEKLDYLHNAGLDISIEKLISAGDVLIMLVKDNNWTGNEVFIVGDLGEPNYADIAGLKITRKIDHLDRCKGVVLGEGYYDWHNVITAVINAFINNPQLPMIVPNPDSYWPQPQTGIGIGAGGVARFICTILHEYGIDIDPIYLGKPYPGIYKYAHDKLCEEIHISDDIPNRNFLMLGDSIASDIRGAEKAGYTSVLLLTGITTEKNYKHKIKKFKTPPDFIFKTL